MCLWCLCLLRTCAQLDRGGRKPSLAVASGTTPGSGSRREQGTVNGTQAGRGFRSLAQGCGIGIASRCSLLPTPAGGAAAQASSEKSGWEESTEQKRVLGGLGSCRHLQSRGLEDSSREGKVDVKWGQQECAGTHGPELEPTRTHGTCAHPCSL